jgi:uncharacterized membrane protein YoaK (UPF0700 family)
VSAGAVDAISYLGLGRVFTANMTGNVVLLGLAVVHGTGAQLVRSGVSLVAYSAGVFVAARIAGPSPGSAVWPRRVTATLALVAATQAALLIGWVSASGRPTGGVEVVLVTLSAVAMGGQADAVRALGVSGVSTTYVTGTLTGFVSGVAGSSGSRGERARRAAVLVALLAGAAAGGLLLARARTCALVLPLALTVAVIATASRPGIAAAEPRSP